MATHCLRLADMPSPHLSPNPDELPGLRAAMRDIQEAIREYYDASTGFVDADTLAAPAKNAIAAIQVLNDLLTNQFSQKQTYAVRAGGSGVDAETVLGFKYLRNVVQHIIHPVEPTADATVGGLGLGFRTFSDWADVPSAVDQQLRTGTRALRPHFERRLRQQPVVQTLLNAAAFFASVSPELVHRRADGEWTGFPLRHQGGVRDRLHPEEPEAESEAVSWMNGRRPGGDCRVICGSFVEDSGHLLFGVTFRGRCVMTPFFETPDHADLDISLGYRYYEAPIGDHTRETRLNDRFDAFDTVLCSDADLGTWVGDALARASSATCDDSFAQPDWWKGLLQLETPPNSQWYLTRRERRLCAWYPIA